MAIKLNQKPQSHPPFSEPTATGRDERDLADADSMA